MHLDALRVPANSPYVAMVARVRILSLIVLQMHLMNVHCTNGISEYVHTLEALIACTLK